MKGIYKLLLVFGVVAIWTLPACGNEWLIREYCSQVQSCDPNVYGDEDYCFNYVKRQVDAYPDCELQFEDFYECDMDMICKGRHNGASSCDSDAYNLELCTGYSPYNYTPDDMY